MNTKTKIVILIFFSYLFSRNLDIISRFLRIVYNGWSGTYLLEKNNGKLRCEIQELFQKNFNLRENFSCLPKFPTIIVSNYIFDRYENLAAMLIPIEMSVVISEIAIKKIKINRVLKHCIVKSEGDGEYLKIKKEIEKSLKEGRSVFAYCSKPNYNSRSKKSKIEKIRTGMFRIAKELGVQITPIAFDYVDSFFGVIPSQNYCASVGRSFNVENVSKSVEKVRKFFEKKLDYFEKIKYIL